MTGPSIRADAKQLRTRTEQILGPGTEPGDGADISFNVTIDRRHHLTVAMNPVCDLAEVQDLCILVANACITATDNVTFTRTTSTHPPQQTIPAPASPPSP